MYVYSIFFQKLVHKVDTHNSHTDTHFTHTHMHRHTMYQYSQKSTKNIPRSWCAKFCSYCTHMIVWLHRCVSNTNASYTSPRTFWAQLCTVTHTCPNCSRKYMVSILPSFPSSLLTHCLHARHPCGGFCVSLCEPPSPSTTPTQCSTYPSINTAIFGTIYLAWDWFCVWSYAELVYMDI